MEYEWDEAKRRNNLAKHGIDFISISGFAWESVQESEDLRKDYGEPRWIAYGMIGTHLYALVYTHRAGRVRVISLRMASQKEFDRYEARARATDG